MSGYDPPLPPFEWATPEKRKWVQLSDEEIAAEREEAEKQRAQRAAQREPP